MFHLFLYSFSSTGCYVSKMSVFIVAYFVFSFFVLFLQLSVDFHMVTKRRVRSLSTPSSTMKRFALMVIKNFKTTQKRGKKFIAQQNTKMRKNIFVKIVFISFLRVAVTRRCTRAFKEFQ